MILLFVIFKSDKCISAIIPEVSIKAGILAVNSDGVFYVKEETRNIPYITKSMQQDFYFGLTVEPNSNTNLTCKVISYMPKTETININKSKTIAPYQKTDVINAQIIQQGDVVKVESEEVECKNGFNVRIQLEENDSTGKYSFEVYVNHNLLRTITFNVTGVR